jgi:hypothetical protein
VQLGRERVRLLLGRDLGREEEPDERLEEGLAVSRLAGEGMEETSAGFESEARERMMAIEYVVEALRSMSTSA